MTLSVTIYFPAHCGHTGSPDWGDVPQGRLWVESRPRRLRPCGPVRSCGPVPFAVTGSLDISSMLHTPSLIKTCLAVVPNPDRYARGSANRLNAVIASKTQLGSPRKHTPALDRMLPVYARLYNDAIIQMSLHGLSSERGGDAL